MAKDWLSRLQKYDNVITDDSDPFLMGIHSPSPSADFVYGNGTWLLPFGYSEVLYGPPKGGKSLFTKMKIGQLHQNDPEAYAVVFDTEFRWRGQLTPAKAKVFGIDLKRCVRYEGNNPMQIFDRIEKNLASDIADGMPLKYIVIDSVTGILGRRELDSDTVETQQIGDHALTIQTGLKRILPTIRKHKIALTIITQVRAEMDQAALKRDPSMKVKMNASYALMHFGEYYVYVAPILGKDGRQDRLGNEFVNTTVTDAMNKGEKTGHRIRVTMKDSSLGPKGRSGEFTWDYHRGLTNVHEEVFVLGVNRGVISNEKQGWYEFDGKKYHGEKDILKALAGSKEMQAAIVKELKLRDLRGDFRVSDDEAAAAVGEFDPKELDD